MEDLVLDTVPSEYDSSLAGLAAELAMSLLDGAGPTAEGDARVPEAVWAKLMAAQVTGPYLDDGIEIPPATAQLMALEKLAYGDPGIALAGATSGCAAMLLSLHGTTLQRAAATDLLRRGARASVALHEGFGRDPSGLATTVTQGPDGSATVRGRKVAVALAGDAEVFVVIGTDDSTGRTNAALVRSPMAGITVQRSDGKAALAAADLGTVQFEVTAAADDVLGGPELDSTALASSIHRVRLVTAAVAVGTGQRAIDYAASYAKDRVAFGRPIAGFQGVSFPLAECHTRLHQARLEIAELAGAIDRGSAITHRDIGKAIAYATAAGCDATRAGVQTLGGNGFMLDYPVGRWYRAAVALSALDFDPQESSFCPAL